MKDPKTVKTRRTYDADFKQEVARMLVSGRSAKKISESFGIAEKRYAVVASISKGLATMKAKVVRHRGKERAKPG